jgi:uncharacterized integral membrane protein
MGERARMRGQEFQTMKPKIIITTVVIISLLIILLQNTQVITLRLFFWEMSMSQIILISLTLLVGFVIGFTVATFLSKRSRNKDKSQVERIT